MFRFLLRVVLILFLILAFALVIFRVAAALREAETAQALLAGNVEINEARTQITPTGGAGSGFIETSRGNIFTMSAGPATGQTLLLAHGTAAWSGFWSPQLRMLARQGYHAVGFDMPPFGFSDRDPDADYTRATQAQRIVELAAAMPQPPILIAHSFGAAAAAEAVLMRPANFAGLVIIDGALGIADTPQSTSLPLPIRPMPLREAALSISATNPLATRTLLRGLLYNKDAARADLVRILQLPQRRQGTTRAYAHWLPSLLAPAPDGLSRSAENYANLALPVRIIWGRMDTVTPPEQAEALARALDQAPVIYIETAGHIPHIESPEDFDAALLSALRDIENARN